MILQTVLLMFGMTLRWFFFFDLCLASNGHKLSNRKMLKTSINHCISGRHRAWRWKILQRDSLGCPLPFPRLRPHPLRMCSKCCRVGGETCTHIRSWWLRVQIQWPWASACTTHTPSNRSGLIECEPSPPASVGKGEHTTRHPPLMDGGHYGSWGQVPLTIKGPSQWLGKNGSGKRREDGKGNCCCRTSKHKRCREKQTGNERRGGGEGGGGAGRGETDGDCSSLSTVSLRTKTVIT